MSKYIFILLLLLVFGSCTKENTQDNENIEGYKPIYISKQLAFEIRSEAPQLFVNPGKMFLQPNLIYITDLSLGVHVIDNSDPYNPQKVAFISIPGVSDIVVKDGIIIADNITDIVSIDVSDLSNIQIKNRLKDIYPIENQYYPGTATGYFECVDTTNGYVVRWEKTMLKNPKCYR